LAPRSTLEDGFEGLEGLGEPCGWGESSACGACFLGFGGESLLTELLLRRMVPRLFLILGEACLEACLRHAAAAAVVTPSLREDCIRGRAAEIAPASDEECWREEEVCDCKTARAFEVNVLRGSVFESNEGARSRDSARGRAGREERWSTPERRRNAPTKVLTFRLMIVGTTACSSLQVLNEQTGRRRVGRMGGRKGVSGWWLWLGLWSC
jgi:hypothetical protein